MSKALILGLTGTFASGKGTVGALLAKSGFVHLSFSDILRDILRQQNKEINRVNLQLLGNELRAQHGDGVLGQKLAEKVKTEKLERVVAETVRHPQEAEALKTAGTFYLLAVTAPLELRYERSQKRLRPEDQVTFDQFQKQQEFEMADNNQGGMQIANCLKQADFTIVNDGALEELTIKVSEVINKILHSPKEVSRKKL